jgi:hypothetical protein
MYKTLKFAIALLIIFLPLNSKAHVNHYKDLNRIEFDIYRNNKLIGNHIFSFVKKDNQISVESEINFEIKKLGVVLYKYHVTGTEIYEDGELIQFNSKTKQNKKDKYVNMKLDGDDFLIDGSSYKGKASKDFLIGTWWNHSIVKAPAQISAVSGRIIKQKVTFIGEEKIKFDGKEINALHFNFSSTDKKLDKDKKLNTNVWYDKETLNWVKATFKKKGNWEYKLSVLK